MQTVGMYPNLVSAQVARSYLESSGIQATIPDEYMAGIDWMLNTAIQGIRLQVHDHDAAQARLLLGRMTPLPDDVDVGPPPSDEPPGAEEMLCPSCMSSEIQPTARRRRMKGLTMLVPVLIFFWPLLASSPRWQCKRCGRRW